MKLKNLKKGDKGKKQAVTQQVKEKVQDETSFPQDQQRTDDVLIDIKADIKKEQPKKNIKARMESNKLVQNQIDTSKLVIQKKQQEKKPLNTWVVDQKDVSKMMAKDFKLHQVQHQFESLTDTKVNEDIKKKKQKIQSQKKTENVNVGGLKFAPISLGGSLIDSKNSDKLVLGKPKSETESPSIAFTPTTLNFTNTKLSENMNIAPIQKTPQQLMDEQYERKQKQRQQQRSKLTSEINPPSKGISKGGWFKKSQPVKQPVKQAPKIQFKQSPWAFTNSNLTNNQQQQPTIKAKPIQKSKQEQMLERMQKADQGMKFLSKKQQQERRKKRQEAGKIQMKVEKV